MFSDLSIKITKELSKEVKKNEGIYFTPNETIELIINLIKPLFIDYKSINILENSCGSGEFIINLIKNFTNINIIIR
jgi:type I restriction-modification system DNA methylase subunit